MSVILKSSRNAKVEVYHTTKCVNVEKMDSQIKVSESKAKQRGLRECKECSGEKYNGTTDNDFSYFMAAKRAGEADD